MVLQSLRSGLNAAQTLENKRKEEVIDHTKIDVSKVPNEPLFCPYQNNWVNQSAKVSFDEKSRQIGWSFVSAFTQVTKAIMNKRDTVYTAYNREATKQYIKDCTKWCQIYNQAGMLIIRKPHIKQRNIGVFELKFNNLRSIQALSGSPENLRAKPGADIIVDEACYRKFPLSDILAAAGAAKIHGGIIRVASTHAGVDSEFNVICKKIKESDPQYKDYGHSRVTFREAVAQGLYRKVCLYKGEIWTQEAQTKWIEEIYADPEIRPGEELDVIPADYSGGHKIFNREIVTTYPWTQNHPDVLYFRYHDLAVSEAADAYYSASVLIAFDIRMNKLFIIDWFADHLPPLAGDDKIVADAKTDPDGTIQIIENEPGPSGTKYVEGMKQRMLGYSVYGYSPIKNKLIRALPAGRGFQCQRLMMAHSCHDYDRFIELISPFDGKKKLPLTNDLVDCISGAYDFIKQSYSQLADDDTMDKYQNTDEGIVLNTADANDMDIFSQLSEDFFS